MKTWIISDTHFGHNQLVYLGHRPEDYENLLLDNLSIVGINDIIYHLGDFSFYNHAYWQEKFFSHCVAKKKILILGNHDKQTKSWYYNHGWDHVCDEVTILAYGKKIILSHVPLVYDKVHKSDVVNVHGHIHNTNHKEAVIVKGFHFPIIMEHDYKSILLQKLMTM